MSWQVVARGAGATSDLQGELFVCRHGKAGVRVSRAMRRPLGRFVRVLHDGGSRWRLTQASGNGPDTRTMTMGRFSCAPLASRMALGRRVDVRLEDGGFEFELPGEGR